MYRVGKVLNHNSIIAIGDDKKEYLMLGKGVGFGKKVSEQFEKRQDDTVYSLQEFTERGEAADIIKGVSPECLEMADTVLTQAEKEFGKIDRNILFPMADHIEFALKRIKNNEQIENPLTDDIRILFAREYNVARCIEPIIWEKMHVKIDAHEVGYIALHIHSAIDNEKVSQAMEMAQAVRTCVSIVEEKTMQKIDMNSLAYNRLMNHVRYMVARAFSKEKLKLNMNDYMEVKYPKEYEMAREICDEIGVSIGCVLDQVEIGYLAIHIGRVVDEDM